MQQTSICTHESGDRYIPPSPGGPDEGQRVDVRHVIERTVADVFDIDPRLLRMPTRGQFRISLARQVCMYIAHVASGMSLTEVGRMWERDRTTAAHACTVVEERRDDAEFNRAIDLIELVVKVLTGPSQRGDPPADG